MYTFGCGFQKKGDRESKKHTFLSPAAPPLFSRTTDSRSADSLPPETERARTPQKTPAKTQTKKNDIIFVGSKKEDKISLLLKKLDKYFNT